jgi:transcriptional regulator with XRE-family HTH domain
MNRKRLQAISRRLTNRAAADYLGISESTFYRYKSGKIKNPNPEVLQKADKLWSQIKSTKPTKNITQKKRIELNRLDYSLDKIEKFKDAKTKHYVYKIQPSEYSEIEGIIKDLIFDKPQYKEQAFMVRVVGQTGDGILKRFSTAMVYFLDVEFLEEQLEKLLSKPSKQLKTVLYYEIVQIVR